MRAGHDRASARRHTCVASCLRVFVASFVATWMVILAMPVGHAQAPATASTPAVASAPAGSPSAVLTQYCVTCHNERAKVGGLALDSKDVDHVAADAATWEKVVRKIRTGMMPPSGARRPERRVLDGFAAELETRLDQAAPGGAVFARSGLASAQSNRVRERHPRPHRPRRRRQGAAVRQMRRARASTTSPRRWRCRRHSSRATCPRR